MRKRNTVFLEHISRYKTWYAILAPTVILIISFCVTKKFDVSKSITLDILSFLGFIISILVLDNTSKNKLFIKKFLRETNDQEKSILENEIINIAQQLLDDKLNFEKVSSNPDEYAKKMLMFTRSLNKYSNHYPNLKKESEVNNYFKFVSRSNAKKIVEQKKTYESYTRSVEKLILVLDLQISSNKKSRIKKMGDLI
ncbi:hypothetical protein JZO78_08180 [Enterococcus ureilyticus]|uniref:hypothetical protein n=1 Tax=Enterococcus ureilyticus TaxID=1131292 RepID=UPI001A92F5F2|nr:hypothetical protein [Enterococcus ureilyticus]MBO0446320.1 hypothetical protein [Enterococcus ureilyticus]